jgi:DNA-binding NtrC family response regulator
MTRSKRVITVGRDPGNRLSGLLATLRGHGYQVVEFPTFEGLFPALNRYPEAVILAYDPAGQSTIRELLPTTSPVIVLVDRSDFDEYYEWMCAGAFDYFELDSDPQWIEHSVRCASARVAAAA